MASKNTIYLIAGSLFKLLLLFSITMKPLSTIAVDIKATSIERFQTNPDVALSTSKITDTPFVFQTGFQRSAWSGTLKKYALTQRKDGSVDLASQAQWEAGQLLTATPPAKRTILSYDRLNKRTITFQFDQLPEDIQMLFDVSPNTQRVDNLGRQRLDYLTGDRTMEARDNGFRARRSVLGDIMHSKPVYVGRPIKNIPGPDYHAFYKQYANRPAAVFVGANDGMLHAFSADAGTELFAYIPSPLLKKLPALTDPTYQHATTMDGNSYVAQARVAGQWRTVLAAGMGGGAKGLFALDVTAPDRFMQERRVLFEFIEADDADIGYVTSAPFITKLRGENKNGLSEDRYFVVVTSGHHSPKLNGGHYSEQFLFLLSLDKDPHEPWSKNSNYYKFSVNSHNSASLNAISSPGFVLDSKGISNYAYSGDLQGNVWRFDFTKFPTSISPTILFSAKDKHNIPQSITATPSITIAPDGGYLILFGTGNAVEQNAENIQSNLPHHSFYAIRDTPRHANDRYPIADRAMLAQREIVEVNSQQYPAYQVKGENFAYANTKSPKKGWHIDFVHHNASNNVCAEQVTAESVVIDGDVFFNTHIPDNTLCQQRNSSFSYNVDAVTGKPRNNHRPIGVASRLGKLGTPYAIYSKPLIGNRNAVGRRNVIQPFSVIQFGTGGAHGWSEIIEQGSVVSKAGRLSWREIANWRDLSR